MTKLVFINKTPLKCILIALLFLFGYSPTEQYTKFNIYRLEQEFPSLVQKQAKKNDLETLNRETLSTININPRLYN